MDLKTIENILNNNGVTLYDTELVKENDQDIFRIYITSKDEITLDKCAEISRIISPIIDLDPPINGAYFLEVSSPGIERALKKPAHFINSIGEKIKIKTNNGKKIVATILDATDENVTIEYNGKKETLKFDEINRAKTYFEW